MHTGLGVTISRDIMYTVRGGRGEDLLHVETTGHAGLIGGADADVFELTWGERTVFIADYEPGVDVVRLDGRQFRGLDLESLSEIIRDEVLGDQLQLQLGNMELTMSSVTFAEVTWELT